MRVAYTLVLHQLHSNVWPQGGAHADTMYWHDVHDVLARCTGTMYMSACEDTCRHDRHDVLAHADTVYWHMGSAQECQRHVSITYLPAVSCH